MPSFNFPTPASTRPFTQRVGLTDIAVAYSRPDKRGREIFGGLGAVWPGLADWCEFADHD